jgi:hypothetical protein
MKAPAHRLWLLALVVCAPLLGQRQDFERKDPVISGPYSHESLTVFLVRGSVDRSGRSLLTLGDALDREKATVRETGNVRELSIENLTSAEDIYVQAGDMVRGGKQDRVLTTDLILAPRSGRQPIGSLCVDQGRWTRRGSESAEVFASSRDTLPTRDLKVAARAAQQQEVWAKVGALADTIGLTRTRAVAAAPAPASMAVALEAPSTASLIRPVVTALEKIPGTKPDAVGCVFVVNGRISSAEVYASRDLFLRMWSKLLRAAATEAATAKGNSASARPPDAAAVLRWLKDCETGASSERAVNPRTKVTRRETGTTLFFETRDGANSDTWIHRSYLAKS